VLCTWWCAAIVASDPEPVFPGLSSDDVLTVYWTKATNQPDVSSTASVQALLGFEPPLASVLRASWQPGSDSGIPAAERLVITLSGAVNGDIAATLLSMVRVSVLPSGGLRDAANTCANATIPRLPIAGTWGDASQPQFLATAPAAIALDYGGQPGLGPGDALLLRFNQPVAQVPVGTKVALDALLAWTPSGWADNYTGEWRDTMHLLVHLTSVPALSATMRSGTAVGTLRVSIKPGGGLTSFDGTSAACNETATVTAGSWGDVVCDGGLNVHSHTAVVAAFTSPTTTTGFTPGNFTLQVSTSAAVSPQPPRTLAVSAVESSSGIALPTGVASSALRYLVPSLATGVTVYVRVAAAVPPLPAEVTRLLPWAVAPVFWPLGGPGGCACADAVAGTGGCGATTGVPQAMPPALPEIGTCACRSRCTAGRAGLATPTCFGYAVRFIALQTT
jgi:hypothetical protein